MRKKNKKKDPKEEKKIYFKILLNHYKFILNQLNKKFYNVKVFYETLIEEILSY